MAEWGSVLLTFLLNVIGICERRIIQFDREALLSGVNMLLDLATAVPTQDGVRCSPHGCSMLARIGDTVVGAVVWVKKSARILRRALRAKRERHGLRSCEVDEAMSKVIVDNSPSRRSRNISGVRGDFDCRSAYARVNMATGGVVPPCREGWVDGRRGHG